jgi:hypothetical protein
MAADYAKASGLRYQIGSFEFVATVELLFDIFEPIDVQEPTPGHGTDACWQCGTLPCLRQGSGGHGSRCEELPCAAAVHRSDQNLQSLSEFVRVPWPGGRGPLGSTPNFDAGPRQGTPARLRLLLYIYPDPPGVGFNFPGQLKKNT